MPGSVLGAGVTTLNEARSVPQEFSRRLAANGHTTPGSRGSCKNSLSKRQITSQTRAEQGGGGHFIEGADWGARVASLGR